MLVLAAQFPLYPFVEVMLIPTLTMKPSPIRLTELSSFLEFQVTNLNTTKHCPIPIRDVSNNLFDYAENQIRFLIMCIVQTILCYKLLFFNCQVSDTNMWLCLSIQARVPLILKQLQWDQQHFSAQEQSCSILFLAHKAILLLTKNGSLWILAMATVVLTSNTITMQ